LFSNTFIICVSSIDASSKPIMVAAPLRCIRPSTIQTLQSPCRILLGARICIHALLYFCSVVLCTRRPDDGSGPQRRRPAKFRKLFQNLYWILNRADGLVNDSKGTRINSRWF
jgi:hypothetical protein